MMRHLNLNPSSGLRRRDERGAVAVMAALLSILVMAACAFAIDYGILVMEKQRLRDTLDTAAHAGAFALPGDSAGARSAAIAMARANDPAVDPTVDMYCVVASTGAGKSVKASQIPATCNPGPPPYVTAVYLGLRCNKQTCAIPCDPDEGDTCNTLRVRGTKDVDYGFANIMGFPEGITGTTTSAACKGPCGTESPNPMDVVVMADRTPSMSDADRGMMQGAIKSMLETMDPALQYVAFGTLHKSARSGDPNYSTLCSTNETSPAGPQGLTTAAGAQRGTWIPVRFSNDYNMPTSVEGAPRPLNANSELFKAVDCLPASKSGGYGTQLVSGIKAAGRYLLGRDPNNLASLPSRPGEPRKVIIFETDGQPDEAWGAGGSTSLNSASDIAYRNSTTSSSPGRWGCQNFNAIASQLKDQGVLIITIGFGQAATADCSRYVSSGMKVKDTLASAASPAADGMPSLADKPCTTTTPGMPAPENTDGDFYYCAANGADLKAIFASAIVQASSGIRLVRLD